MMKTRYTRYSRIQSGGIFSVHDTYFPFFVKADPEYIFNSLSGAFYNSIDSGGKERPPRSEINIRV